jgi:hypothetical protein
VAFYSGLCKALTNIYNTSYVQSKLLSSKNIQEGAGTIDRDYERADNNVQDAMDVDEPNGYAYGDCEEDIESLPKSAGATSDAPNVPVDHVGASTAPTEPFSNSAGEVRAPSESCYAVAGASGVQTIVT